MQYLYKDGDDFVFMDSGTYDQITLSPANVGDAANFMLENQAVTIALHNGDPLYVELPASVVLEITYTEPGPAGRPLHRRHQARDARDRLPDPGAAVPRARHQGQGRHPRRQLPRPRQLVGARTKARKRAIDLLYEADRARSIRWRSPRRVAGEPTAGAGLYRRARRRRPWPTWDRIDELILTDYAEGWTLARLPASTRAVLRVGIWEILFNDDVPDAVAIDEAVGLAKSLSTDESPAS